uniref:Uncharacterized protein n=1 Tax=Aegilops tauschii TaxID=37682 RepID=M8D5F6_AEGTA
MTRRFLDEQRTVVGQLEPVAAAAPIPDWKISGPEEVLLLRVIEATELTTAFAKLRRGERIADNMELRNREAVRSRAFLKASEACRSS